MTSRRLASPAPATMRTSGPVPTSSISTDANLALDCCRVSRASHPPSQRACREGLPPTHSRAAAARFGLRASRLPRCLLLRHRKASSRSAKLVPDPLGACRSVKRAWATHGLGVALSRPLCVYSPRGKACLGRKPEKGPASGAHAVPAHETDSETFAFSIDVMGANLPLVSPHTEWIFLEALDTLNFAAPWDIGDFQVLDYLREHGFYLFQGEFVAPLGQYVRRPPASDC